MTGRGMSKTKAQTIILHCANTAITNTKFKSYYTKHKENETKTACMTTTQKSKTHLTSLLWDCCSCAGNRKPMAICYQGNGFMATTNHYSS
jgi:hypothetical protein